MLAQRGLGQIYRPGYRYFKCSILLMDFSQRGELTPDLFAPAPRRDAEHLMAVVDQINQRKGRALGAPRGLGESRPHQLG